MPSSFDPLREAARAWRISVPIALAQVLGGLLFVWLGWPRAISLMPDVPTAFLQFWIGAVLLSPAGFVPGLLWQRASGVPAPPGFVAKTLLILAVLCAVAVVMLLVP
jgi:hypothetical protein